MLGTEAAYTTFKPEYELPQQTLRTEQPAVFRIPHRSSASPCHIPHRGLATLFDLVVLASLGQTLPSVCQGW